MTWVAWRLWFSASTLKYLLPLCCDYNLQLSHSITWVSGENSLTWSKCFTLLWNRLYFCMHSDSYKNIFMAASKFKFTAELKNTNHQKIKVRSQHLFFISNISKDQLSNSPVTNQETQLYSLFPSQKVSLLLNLHVEHIDILLVLLTLLAAKAK